LCVREDEVMLYIPPPGLEFWDEVRYAAVAAAGLVLLAVLALTPLGSYGPIMLVGTIVGLSLMVAPCYLAAVALLNSSELTLEDDGFSLSQRFPTRRNRRVLAPEFQGAVIGRPDLVAENYSCQDWDASGLALVVHTARGPVHLGQGLSEAELRWVKRLLEEHCPPAGSEDADRESAGTQPPERFWRELARKSAYALLAALVLTLIAFAGGGHGGLILSLLVLTLVLGTVSFMAYRGYELEKSAGGWHRAVMRYQAAVRNMTFNEQDDGSLARRLPDFDFFGGPRKFYNIAWSEDDPYQIILFDYTSAGRRVNRDGVGCALRVRGMSSGRVSVRPRPNLPLKTGVGGMKFEDHPALQNAYRVEAENEGRTRRLFSRPLIGALLDWDGPGPAPWICIRGGMLGLSIRRKHAENENAVQQLCDYALRLREAMQTRLAELRS
jgi:hypothetical protein